jgi:hypothetical protein
MNQEIVEEDEDEEEEEDRPCRYGESIDRSVFGRKDCGKMTFEEINSLFSEFKYNGCIHYKWPQGKIHVVIDIEYKTPIFKYSNNQGYITTVWFDDILVWGKGFDFLRKNYRSAGFVYDVVTQNKIHLKRELLKVVVDLLSHGTNLNLDCINNIMTFI